MVPLNVKPRSALSLFKDVFSISVSKVQQAPTYSQVLYSYCLLSSLIENLKLSNRVIHGIITLTVNISTANLTIFNLKNGSK